MSTSHHSISAERYDCFISFHGSQHLSTLGFKDAGFDITVRDVAREVHTQLSNFGRNPSVFWDEGENVGHLRDSLSHAILQLRGGGVALILLTTEYLTREYCLAELRAFLFLERLRSEPGREDEAIDIRVVVLEPDSRAVLDKLEGVALNTFFGANVFPTHYLPLPVEKRSTCRRVVNAICEHVEDVWNRNESMCLGAKLGDCAFYMANFFPEPDLHFFIHKLGYRLAHFPQGLSKGSFVTKALGEGKFSKFNLEALSKATVNVDAKDAIAAFKRKWCSDGWSWCMDCKDNIHLQAFVEEAERALGKERGPSPQSGESGPSAGTGVERVERTDGSSDIFRTRFPVQSSLDSALVPGAATCLAQLKAAVLRGAHSGDGTPDKGHSVGAGGGLSLCRFALNGEGGVGKTSTCKLLCADPDIQKFFAGGAILWIDVGRMANEAKLVSALRSAVCRCGGKLAAKEFRGSDNLSTAVDCACEFFSGRRILVILDNVWEAPADSCVNSWADAMSKITECPGSAIITTTRLLSLAICPGFQTFELGCLDVKTEGRGDWTKAANLYDAFAKETAEKQACDAYKNIRRKALRLSCGLPLGITTIAGLVQMSSKMDEDADDVLTSVEKEGHGLASKSVGKKMSTIGHDGLYAAMEESLCYLDRREGQTFRRQSVPVLGSGDINQSDSLVFRASYEAFADTFFSARYAALKAMNVSTLRLSYDVLCRLWHLPVGEVATIVRFFANIRLGRIEGGRDSGQEKVFALHDLQYEFCSGLRRSSLESVDGHALLLSSCYSLMASTQPSKSAKSGAALWAQFCFEELSPDAALRKYLSNNLIRHLCSVVPAQTSSSVGEGVPSAAAVQQEILSLLCNFCWLRGRFRSSWGRNSLLRDLSSVFASRLLSSSEAAFLRELQESVVLVVEDDLNQSDGSLASSLVQLAFSIKTEKAVPVDGLLERLVVSAEEEVRGAWLKPVRGCYNSCEPGVLRKAFVSNACVEFLSSLGDGTLFVSLSRDGTVRIHDQCNLSTVHAIGDTGGTRRIAVVRRRLANGPSYIFSGHANGTVLYYEISIDESGAISVSSPVFVGKTSYPISCLFASKDGKFVVAGCEYGRVYQWEVDGDHSGSFELKNTLVCLSGATGESAVKSVVVSGSGKFVAAGCYGGGLYVWREGNESGESVGVKPVPLTCEGHQTDAGFVSLSSDETRLIVLFDETNSHQPHFREQAGPPACEIWNIEAGERRSLRVELPEMGRVHCSIFEGSSDGEKFEVSLLAGGWDKECHYVLIQYSIGAEVKMVGRCLLSALPFSVCRLDCSDVTRVSDAIVGGDEGSVRLFGADAFKASTQLERRALVSRRSGMGVENAIYLAPPPAAPLGPVFAVAVMANARRVVAGHECGGLSLWSAEDGSFDLVEFSERKHGKVLCIDVSAGEGVLVTGHWNRTVLVWDVERWSVRCVLEGHSGAVFGVAALGKGDRIFSVDLSGEWCVWDGRTGGAALYVIKPGLKFSRFGTRACVSSDGGHILWAKMRRNGLWEANLFHAGSHCDVFQSGPREWDDLCAQVDAFLTGTDSTHLWKQAAIYWNKRCELRHFDEQGERRWLISARDTRVQCHLMSAEGALSDRASIDLDRRVFSVAAQWLPHRGHHHRRRAIVACRLEGKIAPAILHFITPKLENMLTCNEPGAGVWGGTAGVRRDMGGGGGWRGAAEAGSGWGGARGKWGTEAGMR